MSILIGWIIRFLSSGMLDRVMTELERMGSGANEARRIEAAAAIEHIRAELGRRQAQRDVLVAEQGRMLTAFMRPAFAYPLAVYYAAVIADSLFHFRWNVAALPGPIGDWSGWIISAIFLAETGERVARTLVNRPQRQVRIASGL